MPALRVAVQLKCLPLPLPKAIAKAREMGAQAVEFDARGQLRPADLTMGMGSPGQLGRKRVSTVRAVPSSKISIVAWKRRSRPCAWPGNSAAIWS